MIDSKKFEIKTFYLNSRIFDDCISTHLAVVCKNLQSRAEFIDAQKSL